MRAGRRQPRPHHGAGGAGRLQQRHEQPQHQADTRRREVPVLLYCVCTVSVLYLYCRYLQKAIMQLDIEQYKMVKEALHERANLLEIAPHLSFPLPIMLVKFFYLQL